MTQTMQQLDIFADSRDVMLRNDVLAPLQRRDVAATRRRSACFCKCNLAFEREGGDLVWSTSQNAGGQGASHPGRRRPAQRCGFADWQYVTVHRVSGCRCPYE
ncbi:hypothetical protein [Paraburkholderia sp. CI3]|uniref:hypothetical protein n=1 Tax=Paraburkholderia sp. CI3 TaxID=2991060 RepID=UPI003D20CA8F